MDINAFKDMHETRGHEQLFEWDRLDPLGITFHPSVAAVCCFLLLRRAQMAQQTLQTPQSTSNSAKLSYLDPIGLTKLTSKHLDLIVM